ncbi:MAG: hypothetical protein Q8M20_04705 [Rhodocyclaceae bacterium]|nr:hypothetical protein [Rhodocyclaceae bacterium]MDZ4214060.1 hypothetical protein [Rhodocyclaceae bacterium]
MMKIPPVYPGLENDSHGITQLGRIVLDARVFGLITDEENCAGWDLQRMQVISNQVEARWDEFGNLPSRLPDDLRARHTEIYARATERARARGWDPELGEDE